MESQVRREDVKRVVIVLAGSRTGSSFLFDLLKKNGHFITLTGEDSPFFRLAGLGKFSASHYDDAIDEIPQSDVLDQLFSLLELDLGVWTTEISQPGQKSSFFLRRLKIQFPEFVVASGDFELLKSICELSGEWDVLYRMWLKGIGLSDELFHTNGRHPLALPLLEEPPYVTPENKIPMTESHAKNLPLLLKTSTNLYRLPLLKALFPRAEFCWIRLHRNPAATLNGLIDGWLSSAFHSHRVSPWWKLAIKGYSDRIPGGDQFWKFDMPPGWSDWVNSSIEEVCAFQSLSALKRLEAFESESRDSVKDVRYEDLIKEPIQMRCIRNLVHFAGADPRDSYLKSRNPIMAVRPPGVKKWKLRSAKIIETLQTFDEGMILKIARQNGYHAENLEEWP